MLRIYTVVFFVLFPSFLLAEEIGTMTVELDGEARRFHFISVTRGERTAMSAGFVDHERLPSLNLQAHPEPRFTTRDVVSVSGSWFGGYSADKPLTGVEILFLPEGMSKPFYTTDQVPGDPDLTLDSFGIDGDTGQASGTFSGKLCRVEKLYEAPDMNDCKDISGTFETVLQVRGR